MSLFRVLVYWTKKTILLKFTRSIVKWVYCVSESLRMMRLSALLWANARRRLVYALGEDFIAEGQTIMEVDETGTAALPGYGTPVPRPIDLHSRLNESIARDILDLPAYGDVSKEDVDRQFKVMARLWHHDKRAGKEVATKAFKRINMAKRYLLSILSGDLPSHGHGAKDDDEEASFSDTSSEAEDAASTAVPMLSESGASGVRTVIAGAHHGQADRRIPGLCSHELPL